MSDLTSFAVDPDPAFVDRLESLLLAELELAPHPVPTDVHDLTVIAGTGHSTRTAERDAS